MKKEHLGESFLAFITVLIMWAGYYIDNHNIFPDSIIWTIVWGFGVIVGINVLLPTWWIVIHKKEGFAGMGITKKNLGQALLFSVALGGVRLFDLFQAIQGLSLSQLLPVFLFNLFSIWETCFLYCWLFTRYRKAFGKNGAVLLTTLSICIYHLGTLPTPNLMILLAYTFLCALCYSVTENIFTLWPIYWVIGCSASVIKSYGADSFPWEMTLLMAVVFVVHLSILFIIKKISNKRMPL